MWGFDIKLKTNKSNLMKNILITILLLLIAFSTQAQEKKNQNSKFTIEVNGNCDMCKKRIEKAAFETKGVKSAVWDIETHQLNLILNEEKCSSLAVEQNIAKAGHDTNNVKATDADYDNLHGCCRYERD
jgi:copper chaperone CopZ